MTTVRSEARLQQSLAEISGILAKHRVLDTMTHRLEGPRRDLLEHIQHQQNLVELQRRLRTMHAADVAHVVEALPLADRRTVWAQLEPERAGHAFVELSPAQRASIVDLTPRGELISALEALDPDDLGFVSESLPPDLLDTVTSALEVRERSVFEESVQYPEGAVGCHMSREWVAVKESDSVQVVLDALRALNELPSQTDRLFAVDARNALRGDMSLQTLLVAEPAAVVADIMRSDALSFSPHDDAREAAKAFERYDLVSAAVVDERGRLVGRLTVDAVMDVIRDESELRALQHAGLTGDEDLFASPWDSARNRWPWLAVNLVTAFVASRVIGRFEGLIQQLAAVATLMPIVASIGGNTGNQTMALVVRGMALDQLRISGARRLLTKELLIGLLNGGVWGAIVGAFAVALYSNLALGVVMGCAVVLNLTLAALAGVVIPLALQASGRDPAQGASVLLTFTTDAAGFFLFLGLANVFLV